MTGTLSSINFHEANTLVNAQKQSQRSVQLVYTILCWHLIFRFIWKILAQLLMLRNIRLRADLKETPTHWKMFSHFKITEIWTSITERGASFPEPCSCFNHLLITLLNQSLLKNYNCVLKKKNHGYLILSGVFRNSNHILPNISGNSTQSAKSFGMRPCLLPPKQLSWVCKSEANITVKIQNPLKKKQTTKQATK